MPRRARSLVDNGYYHIITMGNDRRKVFQSDDDYVRRSPDLPKFMQGILQVQASYFHRRYDSVGFLFQNRYKGIQVEKESYLLECARYTERNPVQAKICDDSKDYRWSSYLFYAKGKENLLIGGPNPCFSDLSGDLNTRRRMFCDFVRKEGPYDHIIDKAIRIK